MKGNFLRRLLIHLLMAAMLSEWLEVWAELSSGILSHFPPPFLFLSSFLLAARHRRALLSNVPEIVAWGFLLHLDHEVAFRVPLIGSLTGSDRGYFPEAVAVLLEAKRRNDPFSVGRCELLFMLVMWNYPGQTGRGHPLLLQLEGRLGRHHFGIFSQFKGMKEAFQNVQHLSGVILRSVQRAHECRTIKQMEAELSAKARPIPAK